MCIGPDLTAASTARSNRDHPSAIISGSCGFFCPFIRVLPLHPTQHYTLYIDEAGDEGLGKLASGPIGGQSRWLALGGCIVSRENDLKMPAWRDRITARFPLKKTRDLHFRNLKHDQKIVVCQEIASLPVGICVAFSHKVTIPGSRWEATFKQKGYLYNFLLRWLLERVSTTCYRKANPAPCLIKIVFSRRGNTDYQTMKDYLILMRDGKEQIQPIRSIDWRVIDIEQIAVENHSRWAGLQIADCATSAFFSAVEPNQYGNYEPAYGRMLKPRLIRSHAGDILNCGLTPVPSMHKSQLDAEQRAFFESFIQKE